MPDDLDALLRRTMKTLDDQVPSGYFDGLPNQTLARLEADMQSGVDDSWSADPSAAPPPPAKPSVVVPAAPIAARVAPPSVATPSHVPEDDTQKTEREEDSGLHDIRSLAQSTKHRLSVKRITTSPPISDDVASSSAGWKAVALPQPAKMVSLPALDELPSAKEVRAKDKAARAGRRMPADAAPAVEIDPSGRSAMRQPFSSLALRKRGKGGMIALVGVGLAAAAGAVIFVTTQKSDKSAAVSDHSAAQTLKHDEGAHQERARGPATPTAPPAVAAAVQPAPEAPPSDGKADLQLATDQGKDTATLNKVSVPLKAGHVGKGKPDKTVDHAMDGKIDKTPPVSKVEGKKAKGEGGEPSFDDLLKEAGVDKKKEAKPKLDKKALSGDDFKHGMASVAAKAQSCYKGTQGTASVKLTIAPSGQVSKVTVGGQFAGGPEATCVSNAVKSAAFPPWDGGPASFNYSYLLSE